MHLNLIGLNPNPCPALERLVRRVDHTGIANDVHRMPPLNLATADHRERWFSLASLKIPTNHMHVHMDTNHMTSTEYRAALAALGLTQAEAATYFGFSIRSSNGYANGAPIPEVVARFLMATVRPLDPLIEKPASSGRAQNQTLRY